MFKIESCIKVDSLFYSKDCYFCACTKGTNALSQSIITLTILNERNDMNTSRNLIRVGGQTCVRSFDINTSLRRLYDSGSYC